MHFLQQVFYWRRGVWKWFLLTVLPASLPFIVSIIVAASKNATEIEAYIKLDDLIFMGLTINISCVGVWSTRLSTEMKYGVTFFSVIGFFVLTICITLSRLTDVTFTPVVVIAATSVLVSLAAGLKMNSALYRLQKGKPKNN